MKHIHLPWAFFVKSGILLTSVYNVYRDANCSSFAVFNTFFKLQILVILSNMHQNTFFFLQGSLCVHFYGNKMQNNVFQAKILFSSSKILFSFVRGWHLCVYGNQNEFVDSVTRVFILRICSLGQNGPLRRDAVFAVARIVLVASCPDTVTNWKHSTHLSCIYVTVHVGGGQHGRSSQPVLRQRPDPDPSGGDHSGPDDHGQGAPGRVLQVNQVQAGQDHHVQGRRQRGTVPTGGYWT